LDLPGESINNPCQLYPLFVRYLKDGSEQARDEEEVVAVPAPRVEAPEPVLAPRAGD
jgi:hypothetical protein